MFEAMFEVTDATFLARVVRHYVTHPERRAAIGTAAEHRWLTRLVDAPAVDRG